MDLKRLMDEKKWKKLGIPMNLANTLMQKASQMSYQYDKNGGEYLEAIKNEVEEKEVPVLNFNGNSYAKDAIEKGAAYAIVDEEAHVSSKQTILVDNVLETLQKLANYHRKQLNIPIVSLTGSNGKTVVKEWLSGVLSDEFQIIKSPRSYNSQIGVALSLLSDEHAVTGWPAVQGNQE